MEFDYLLAVFWVAVLMFFLAPIAITERRNNVYTNPYKYYKRAKKERCF